MLALTLCAMIALRSNEAFVPADTPVQDSPLETESAPQQDEPLNRWLEVVEMYTLPSDPAWRTTALSATTSDGFRELFSEALLELAERQEAIKKRAEGAKRAEDKAKIEKQGKEEIERKKAKLAEGLVATADKPMPLTVLRVWDGVSKSELVLTMGRGQRATIDRFKQGKPLFVEIGLSSPPADFQSFRPTVKAVLASTKAPSDFAAASDAPAGVHELAFGEVNPDALPGPVVVRAVKDPAPGSGALTISIEPPPLLESLNKRYPWYAEFRLYELTKDGKRGREVEFKGPNALSAVAEPTPPEKLRQPKIRLRLDPVLIATGRVEVKSPQPWGYEAEIVRWFGVAPKSKLKSATAGTAGPSGSAAPPSTPQPDASVPPVLPPEPETPEIPDSGSSPNSER